MIILGITLDPGLVYLILGSVFSLNATLLAWILNTLINIRGRMHRLEAREEYIDATMTKLENHLNEIIDDLLPHRRKK
jgi:hypothetical protein